MASRSLFEQAAPQIKNERSPNESIRPVGLGISAIAESPLWIGFFSRCEFYVSNRTAIEVTITLRRVVDPRLLVGGEDCVDDARRCVGIGDG